MKAGSRDPYFVPGERFRELLPLLDRPTIFQKMRQQWQKLPDGMQSLDGLFVHSVSKTLPFLWSSHSERNSARPSNAVKPLILRTFHQRPISRELYFTQLHGLPILHALCTEIGCRRSINTTSVGLNSNPIISCKLVQCVR